MVALARAAVDKLTQEARQEELHTKHHGSKAEVEEWLVGNGDTPRQLLHHNPRNGHKAREEHQRAEASKEVHRRASEVRHEGYGDKVEVALNHALEAKLRVAILALVVLNDLLANALEAACLARMGI